MTGAAEGKATVTSDHVRRGTPLATGDPPGPGTTPSRMGNVFAVTAFTEAATWAALLVGMFLKYVTETTELGVTIAGNLHGYAFLSYVIVAITAAIRLRWGWGIVTLALLAAIPPLATVPLERWMRRTERLRRGA